MLPIRQFYKEHYILGTSEVITAPRPLHNTIRRQTYVSGMRVGRQCILPHCIPGLKEAVIYLSSNLSYWDQPPIFLYLKIKLDVYNIFCWFDLKLHYMANYRGYLPLPPACSPVLELICSFSNYGVLHGNPMITLQYKWKIQIYSHQLLTLQF